MKKTAAVTGSRRGIGFAVARAFAENGYYTVISGVSSAEDAAPALAELRKNGAEADYIRCDISDAGERDNFLRAASEPYGRLDVLVNNAGVAPKVRLDLLETTEESFDFVLDTNLKGTFFMCQCAARIMTAMKNTVRENFSPRIINIASISSYTASLNRGEYCISKAGISMVTQLFAARLAEYGIPVFEVRPGVILTDMTAPVKGKYEDMVENGLTPIKRLGLPEDVADCVMAAAGGQLDFATGQILNADGGFHIRRL